MSKQMNKLRISILCFEYTLHILTNLYKIAIVRFDALHMEISNARNNKTLIFHIHICIY